MAALRYRITSIEAMADGIKIFRMGAENERLQYQSGQFVMLHALGGDGETTVKRPYSLASSPDQPYLEFCIKMVGGQMTSLLDKAKVGDVYGVEGPMGHFFYEGQESCAFVAGGTGIAPCIGMLRTIRDRGIRGKFLLLYSTKTRDSAIYLEELEEMKRIGVADVVITLTRETPKGWKGESGRIDERMIMKHARDVRWYSWYLCGPLEMAMKLKECLVRNGADTSTVRLEGWG